MTIQTIRRGLKNVLDGIYRLQETLFRSMPLTAMPLGTLPPCNWRDYDVPTFKRRGIRLSIGQDVAHR
jgi:hypothetical protein